MPKQLNKVTFIANNEGRLRRIESQLANALAELDRVQALVTRLSDRVHYLIEERQDRIRERRDAKASMCEVSTVLSAEEERVRMDRNETNRPVSERIHSTGDRSPGLLGTVQSVAKRSV